MKIRYDDEDDILHVEFSGDRVVRDISYGWNVNIAYGARSIGAITILDAKAKGYWLWKMPRNYRGLRPDSPIITPPTPNSPRPRLRARNRLLPLAA
jgi:uncharacterized protein YuzE